MADLSSETMDPYIQNFTHAYGTQRLYEFQQWYAHYHGYVSVVVCAYGIVCNIFNILVLTRKNMISTTNYILTGLAVADLLTMVSYVPFALQFYCIHGTQPTPDRNTKEWIYFFLFHINFTVTTHTTSIWLGVLLSVFRYAYVKSATNGSVACTLYRAKVLVGLVYLWSIVILVPNYLSIKTVSIPEPTTNRTYYDLMGIDTSTLYGDLITRLNFWLHALLIKIIPCALMSIFGFLLVGTMRHTQKRTKRLRRQSTRAQTGRNRNRAREHARTTRMLVVVIVLFLVTELPQGILALLSGLLPGFFEAFYVPLGDAMDIIALINNAINFTLYCSMSKQFRQTFLEILCPAIKRDPRSRLANGTSMIHDNNVGIHTRLVQEGWKGRGQKGLLQEAWKGRGQKGLLQEGWKGRGQKGLLQEGWKGRGQKGLLQEGWKGRGQKGFLQEGWKGRGQKGFLQEGWILI